MDGGVLMESEGAVSLKREKRGTTGRSGEDVLVTGFIDGEKSLSSTGTLDVEAASEGEKISGGGSTASDGV